MEIKELKNLINISGIPFEGIHWDDEEYRKFDVWISDIEFSTLDEIEKNLFGKTILEKTDVIRRYVSAIGEINYNILWVNFDDDDEKDIYAVNHLALEKVKYCYQFIIDGICTLSYQNNINLIKILEDNPTTHGMLNIDVYNEKIKTSAIEKGSKLNLLKANILTAEGFDLFEYLLKNFDEKYTNHNKFSCLYILLSVDGHLNKDLRPEQFKSIIKASPFNIGIKFSLYNENELSSKIKKHYETLKNAFYKSA